MWVKQWERTRGGIHIRWEEDHGSELEAAEENIADTADPDTSDYFDSPDHPASLQKKNKDTRLLEKRRHTHT
jgi:hypothetical protein